MFRALTHPLFGTRMLVPCNKALVVMTLQMLAKERKQKIEEELQRGKWFV